MLGGKLRGDARTGNQDKPPKRAECFPQSAFRTFRFAQLAGDYYNFNLDSLADVERRPCQSSLPSTFSIFGIVLQGALEVADPRAEPARHLGESFPPEDEQGDD